MEPAPSLAERAGNFVGQVATAAYNMIPGAAMMDQASASYQSGNIGTAVLFAAGSIVDAGIGVATLGESSALRAGSKTAVTAYEVGTYNSLRARSVVGDALDIHHVGQAAPMGQSVSNYSRTTAPCIVLPQPEHALIPTIRGTTFLSPRTILANDIKNLRNLTDAPNRSLQELIDLNRTLYPEAFAK